MTNENRCILAAGCKLAGDEAQCNNLCPHFIAVHGQTGDGGRVRDARIPTDYTDITVDNSPIRENQPEAYRLVDAYVKTFKRQFEENGERIKSLYLWSDATGTGKTTTAAAVANEYIKRHYIGSRKRGLKPKRRPVFFLDMNELQGKYNEANRSNTPKEIAEPASRSYYEMLKAAKETDLLIVDDIGLRSASEAFRQDVHRFINHRASNEMPVVWTSNLPIDSLKTLFSKQIWDRVRDMCVEVEFQGESKRGVRR